MMLMLVAHSYSYLREEQHLCIRILGGISQDRAAL